MHTFALRRGSPLLVGRRSTPRPQREEVPGVPPRMPPLCTLYVAGACEQDPGPGGWAYVQASDGTPREESGAHPDTTTTRMQLTAAIKALEATTPGTAALVYTASPLVPQGMTEWVHKWLRDGWRTGSGQPVDNQDLWERLHTLAQERSVRWECLHVPGAEATDDWLQRAQALADAAGRRAAASTQGGPATGRGAGAGVDEDLNRATDQRMEGRMPDREPRAQPSLTGVRPHTPLAECQALEQRWVELHEEVLRLDQEWQHLRSMVSSRVEAQRSGQSPSWTDGARLFYELDKYAARTSHLALEALQTCHQYGVALQQAMDDLTEEQA